MPYCRECGNELRAGAEFCDRCGAAVDGAQPTVTAAPSTEIYRSTRLYVAQQRLIASILLVGVGIVALVMAAAVPPMPPSFFNSSPDYTFNTIATVMGLVMIGIGIAIYFLGGASARKE